MVHEMRLNPKPFAEIRAGTKTVELRLWDEKRQKLRVGDSIRFTNNVTGEQLLTRVQRLHRFDSFRELFAALPSGWGTGTPNMDAYYAPEEQQRWGVVGIELALCLPREITFHRSCGYIVGEGLDPPADCRKTIQPKVSEGRIV